MLATIFKSFKNPPLTIKRKNYYKYKKKNLETFSKQAGGFLLHLVALGLAHPLQHQFESLQTKSRSKSYHRSDFSPLKV